MGFSSGYAMAWERRRPGCEFSVLPAFAGIPTPLNFKEQLNQSAVYIFLSETKEIAYLFLVLMHQKRVSHFRRRSGW
jgi:hypothetical protein